ncbi:MAG: type II toxin-antitoxin system RelE/ParE family toxin [Sphingorhabdus sp.]
MIVRLTAEAERDLEAIGDYISADSPDAVALFIREMREKCLGLADFPARFPLVPRYEASGVRRRVHGNYLIFYCVEPDAVTVLHILNGTMDYEALLFPQ